MSSSSASSTGSRRSSSRNVVSRGRYWLAALCFLLMRVSLVTTLGLVVWVFINYENTTQLHLYGLGLSIGLLVATSIHVIANGRRVTCPLCRASYFMSTRNLVKPGVPKFITCAKTPLAFSLLTMPTVVRCPCCAERVRLVRSGN